jgi:hypothetical protein
MMNLSRRMSSVLCLVAFLAGFLAVNVSPVLADAYRPSYDGTEQQDGDYSIFPAIIGGVAGLTVGGLAAGPVGAMAGGIGGFTLGNAVAKHFIDGTNPVGPAEKVNSGFMVNYLPGIAGAVAGIAITAGMGPLALIVGGATGFFLGKILAQVLFPQMYFGGPEYERSASTYTGTPAISGTLNTISSATFMPKAAVSEISLSDLKDVFYDSMSEYKAAMATGSSDEVKAARGQYLEAQNAYFDAKRLAAE